MSLSQQKRCASFQSRQLLQLFVNQPNHRKVLEHARVVRQPLAL